MNKFYQENESFECYKTWFIQLLKFTLEQAMNAPSGSRDIALLFPWPRRQMWVGGQHHAPAALPFGKKLVTHYARGWVVPIAGLEVCGKSHPCRDSIPRLSSR